MPHSIMWVGYSPMGNSQEAKRGPMVNLQESRIVITACRAHLDEQELRPGRDPVIVAAATAEGSLDLHLHRIVQLRVCHLG